MRQSLQQFADDVNQPDCDGRLGESISSKLGWMAGPSPTADQIYQEFIVQGQSYYQRPGIVTLSEWVALTRLTVFGQPSDSPLCELVGGTT